MHTRAGWQIWEYPLEGLSAGLLGVEDGEAGRSLFVAELIAAIKVDTNFERLHITWVMVTHDSIIKALLRSVAAVATGLGKLVQPAPQTLSPTMVEKAVVAGLPDTRMPGMVM